MKTVVPLLARSRTRKTQLRPPSAPGFVEMSNLPAVSGPSRDTNIPTAPKGSIDVKIWSENPRKQKEGHDIQGLEYVGQEV